MVVLLALIVVSGFVIALTLSARTRVITTHNFAEREEARLLADGLTDLLAQDWANDQHPVSTTLGLTASGQTRRCRVDRNVVDYRVVSTSGLVDINFASPLLLQRLFLAVRLPEARAQSLAAAIVDFRDNDNEPQPGGAELNNYVAAGRNFGPKNALFETISELDQVLGMTRDVMAAISSYVTVHSRTPTIDLGLAPPELAAALNQADDFRLQELIGHAADGSRIVRTIITVETLGSFRFVRDAIAERSPNSKRGFVFLDWSAGRGHTQIEPSARSDLKSCF